MRRVTGVSWRRRSFRRKRSSACSRAFAGASHYLERDVYKKVLGGELGKIQAAHGTYLGGTPWVKPREPGWTDLEYQLRNWIHMTWLSGDHLIEQAIHTVDKMSWAFDDVAAGQRAGHGRPAAARRGAIRQRLGSLLDRLRLRRESARAS